MTVDAPQRRLGGDVDRMGCVEIEQAAGEYVVAREVACLMRTPLAHDGCLGRQRLQHVWQAREAAFFQTLEEKPLELIRVVDLFLVFPRLDVRHRDSPISLFSFLPSGSRRLRRSFEPTDHSSRSHPILAPKALCLSQPSPRLNPGNKWRT